MKCKECNDLRLKKDNMIKELKKELNKVNELIRYEINAKQAYKMELERFKQHLYYLE